MRGLLPGVGPEQPQQPVQVCPHPPPALHRGTPCRRPPNTQATSPKHPSYEHKVKEIDRAIKREARRARARNSLSCAAPTLPNGAFAPMVSNTPADACPDRLTLGGGQEGLSAEGCLGNSAPTTELQGSKQAC